MCKEEIKLVNYKFNPHNVCKRNVIIINTSGFTKF